MNKTNSGGLNDNTAPSLSINTFMKTQVSKPEEFMHSIPITVLESLEKEVTSEDGQVQDFVKTLLQKLVSDVAVEGGAKSSGTVIEINEVHDGV